MIKFTVEEYQNIVSLLKQALLFYADEKNYTDRGNDRPILTRIEMDKGSQAKFALDKINELEKMYLNTINEYKNISEFEALEDFKKISEENKTDESLEEFLNTLKSIKNE